MKLYFHGSDYIKNDFVPFPMLFFQYEQYKSMSSDAKVLYALLLNRSQLSFKNGWLDENNRVYMYFAREDMCNALNISQPTLRKAIKQLIDLELLDEVRQGLGKANRLYLLQPHVLQMEECFTDEENQDPQPEGNSQRTDAQPDGNSQGKNLTFSVKDSFSQECNTLSGNKKENNNNKNNNILIRKREEMREEVKLKINFQFFEGGTDEQIALSVVDIAVDILISDGSSYRIGRKYYDLAEVQNVFNQVNKDAVLHVIDAVKDAGRIANYKKYVTAVIFNYINNPAATEEKQKPKHSINNFSQREYDYDLLMKQLQEVNGVRG